MKYVGLDVHKEYIYGTVLDESGRVKTGEVPVYSRWIRGVLQRHRRCQSCDGSQVLLGLRRRVHAR